MKESKPPWVTVEISERARRMQKLCDDEIKRRRTGIPKEHWRYVGLSDKPASKRTKIPYLKIVDAEVEIVEPTEPRHGGGGPTWDFYLFLGITGMGFVLGSYLLVDVIVGWLRGAH